MSLRLYAINCGWQTGPLGLFLAGEHGRLRVPTPSYLIDHPKGKVSSTAGSTRISSNEPDQIAANYYDPRNYHLGHDVARAARMRRADLLRPRSGVLADGAAGAAHRAVSDAPRARIRSRAARHRPRSRGPCRPAAARVRCARPPA